MNANGREWRWGWAALLCLALMFSGTAAGAQRIGLPTSLLPDGLGVNIHFTDPRPGEMKMLAEGGFRWVRMDFGWGSTEIERGKYDFSAYDRLMAALKPYGIRPVFILDYSNRLYDNDESPHSDEAIAAFARWSAAAARHFSGQGVLWEMYNEPNIGFWRPKPNVDQYVRLALAVGKALREAAPKEVYIGPATSTLPFDFLETCFKAGLLEFWSAVSVHPYRQSDPETSEDDLRRLRLLIRQYAPKGKRIPILSGEWGYSSGWGGMTDEKQGKMLARQWLINIANDVPLSIWYDWHDDGTDPKEPEHHFGTVQYAYHAGRDPVYDLKPSYLAAKTLTSFLKGFRFNKRLDIGSSDDYVLLFARGSDIRIAAWTRAAAHEVAIPASPGTFIVEGHTGNAMPSITADSRGLRVPLTDAPLYLLPSPPNEALRVAAAWGRLPLEETLKARPVVGLFSEIHNPFARPIEVQFAGRSKAVPAGQNVALTLPLAISRGARSQSEVVTLGFGGQKIVQRTTVFVANALIVTVLPESQGEAPILVENPSGEPFTGTVTLLSMHPTDKVSTTPRTTLYLGSGTTEATVRVPDPEGALQHLGAAFELRETPRAGSPASRFQTETVRMDSAADLSPAGLADRFELVADGDSKVASVQSLAPAEEAETLALKGQPVVRIDYQFDAGWKFVELKPKTDTGRAISGRPRETAEPQFGIWIRGDGSGNIPRLRFTDATGQTFQPDGDAITWKGWKYVTFPMNGSRAGHWGGPNDGVVHYPIKWDSLFLLDSANQQRTGGTIYVAAPTLIYKVQAHR